MLRSRSPSRIKMGWGEGISKRQNSGPLPVLLEKSLEAGRERKISWHLLHSLPYSSEYFWGGTCQRSLWKHGLTGDWNWSVIGLQQRMARPRSLGSAPSLGLGRHILSLSPFLLPSFLSPTARVRTHPHQNFQSVHSMYILLIDQKFNQENITTVFVRYCWNIEVT